jgi:hypothetical protein
MGAITVKGISKSLLLSVLLCDADGELQTLSVWGSHATAANKTLHENETFVISGLTARTRGGLTGSGETFGEFGEYQLLNGRDSALTITYVCDFCDIWNSLQQRPFCMCS